MTINPVKWLHAAAVALLVIGAAPTLAQHAEAGHAWTYEGESGPARWGELKPEYQTCKVGKQQSPIDIRGAQPADLPAIEFAYQPSALKILDNGHSIQVNYAPGSFITANGKQYELTQFHFHRPSEEQVNGKAYAMVAHLVHKDAGGNLAVVAVLLANGQANPLLETLWSNLPEQQGQENAPAGVTIDLGKFLPAQRGYYTFIGSLTTPPCSEDVTWLVLKTPVLVSKAEVAAFGRKYPHNVRPVQPLNGRVLRMTR